MSNPIVTITLENGQVMTGELYPEKAPNTVKAVDFPLVHQQAAGTYRVPVKNISVFIGADVHSVEINFSVFGNTVGILQI